MRQEEYHIPKKKLAGEAETREKKVRIYREEGYDSRRNIHSRGGKHAAGGKRRRKKGQWVKYFFLVLFILAAAGALGLFFWTYAMMSRIQKDPQIKVEDITNPHIDTGTRQVMRENWTIAVFGVDSTDGSLGKGSNADVIMLCNINQKTGAIRVVSVYRDTCMKIGEKNPYRKINEAYARGGIKQAVEALNENLDIEIDDYIAVNWKAVADAVNLLGGIDMDITRAEFRDINSYITSTVKGTGVGSYQLESPGPNHLDGVQTVAYARLRKMDTDFQRTERQREVLKQVLEKAKAADFSVMNNILIGVLPQTMSSLEMDSLIPIAANLKKYHLEDTAGFPFDLETKRIRENKRGIDYVFPIDLESNVVKLHQFLYGTEEYAPSQQVKEISKAVEEKRKSSSPSVNTQETKEKSEKETKEESRPETETRQESEPGPILPTTEAFDPTAPELFWTAPME